MTRFYFNSVDEPVASPPFNAGWEQTGEAVRRKLDVKTQMVTVSPLTDFTCTVPITTTQDILCAQFVSEPVRGQAIAGNFSFVCRMSESDLAVNATMGLGIFVHQPDGSVITIAVVQSTGVEIPVTPETRNRATGATTVQFATGSVIVLELGARVTAPSGAGTFTLRFGSDAATDFAYSSGLTTDLNPSLNFGHDLFSGPSPYTRGVRPYPFSPGLTR